MSQPPDDRPTPEEVANKIKEFVANPPREVIESMKRRLDERNRSTAQISDCLLHTRCG